MFKIITSVPDLSRPKSLSLNVYTYIERLSLHTYTQLSQLLLKMVIGASSKQKKESQDFVTVNRKDIFL
jgi:hypothetical protein